MVELLATFGASAKELFSYNRDYYMFDQKQRLDREMLRIEMQIKRFDLFRDDIRDLVELTTSKMEMYHLVGALVLEFCVLIYTEGAELAWISEAPPFMKACFGLSLASAFTYIILAVWLSMHASVSAQSFGTRLLTRFVRLPIPGQQQINALNAKLTDFEKQGASRMLRVPFVSDAQRWDQIRHQGGSQEETQDDGDARFKPAVQVGGAVLQTQDLLGGGEKGINEEDLCNAATQMPGHHVQLFRRLQARWQCYDTYARICMSLGAYHILASISYYMIIVTMKHYFSVTTGFAVITVFIVALTVLGALDVGKGMLRYIMLVQMCAAIPIYLAAGIMASTMLADLEEQHTYPYAHSPLIFLFVAIWHEGLLHMAWPSNDGMCLPRRFRTVLFIDVFAVADEALRQQFAEEQPSRKAGQVEAKVNYNQEEVVAVEESLYVAESALRRWQAVPPGTSEAKSQDEVVKALARRLRVTRKMLNGEAARLAGLVGDQEAMDLLRVDTRGWNDLTPEEQKDDPFTGSLVGPFQHRGQNSEYFYDVESGEFVWQPGDREIITLEELDELVSKADHEVKCLLVGSPDYEESDTDDNTDIGPVRAKSGIASRNDQSQKFVQQRLPWRAVCGMTRVLELAWGLEAAWFAFEQMYPKYRIDKYVEAEERRLGMSSMGGWTFEDFNVDFPHGAFFRPSGLSCLSDGPGQLLVSTADALYRASTDTWLALDDTGASGDAATGNWASMARRLEELPQSAYPSSAVALCGIPVQKTRPSAAEPDVAAAGTAPCLMGEATEQGIALWPLGADRHGPQTVVLRLEGQPWALLAGAIVRCSDAAGLFAGMPADAAGALAPSWCLLLTGWDGVQLPVAAVTLPRGPGAPPDASAIVSPAFDAPLTMGHDATTSAIQAVSALHLEPRRGRLWATLASGAIQAWELLGEEPKSLGRWMPSLKIGQGSRPKGSKQRPQVVAVCEDSTRSQLVVAVQSTPGSPQLMRAPLTA